MSVSWPRRLGFLLQAILTTPIVLVLLLARIPRKLLAEQTARGHASQQHRH